MELLRAPKQFDLILAPNMFGDILSDAAAMLTGSIGMLPSASIGEGNKGLYEPVHGSAPGHRGQGHRQSRSRRSSPRPCCCATVSAAKTTPRASSARCARCWPPGYRTADIFQPGTKQSRHFGDGRRGSRRPDIIPGPWHETPDLKRIGRYDIERVLGEGAMGVVYEGNDTRLHRKVAIKTILKSALDSDSAKEYSMRFAREAQAVARLNHPNIVQVFDFAEEGDVAYIVMEMVRGRELKTFFDAKERFELKEVVHIMGELCEALHFAHEAGIIHRDIKPANVMIDSQGRVKLTDFGVARIADPDRTVSDKTQAGTVVGTPAYMSPEQIQGLTLDRRSDIFSAGVILYEFLCGAKPFAGHGRLDDREEDPRRGPAGALQPSTRRCRRCSTRWSPRRSPKNVEPALPDRARARLRAAARGRGPRRRSTSRKRPLRMRAIPGGGGAARTTGDATVLRTLARRLPRRATKATELEFWRSIKDGNDPADFDLYVRTVPERHLRRARQAQERQAARPGLRRAGAGAQGDRGGGAPRGRGAPEAGRGKGGDGSRARQARSRIPAARSGAEQARGRGAEEDPVRSRARRARAGGGGRRPLAGAQAARPDGASASPS